MMDLFTKAEILDGFQISRSTLYRMLAAGMPSIGTGRLRRFNLDAVLEWIDTDYCGKPKQPAPETQRDKPLDN